MLLQTLFRSLKSGWSRRHRRPRRTPALPLWLETLEDRSVPAVFTVSSLTDVVNPNDGVLTLREAIGQANSSAGADTITFGVAGTINVQSPLPTLNDTSGGTRIDGTTAPGYAGAPVIVLHGP